MSIPIGTLGPLPCARPGCFDRYDQHAPGGGGCLVWAPGTGEHCRCRGFQWVPLAARPQELHSKPGE